jgi:hypothetical protein
MVKRRGYQRGMVIEDWETNKQFYTEAAGQFFNFKEAWRNYVAHSRTTYQKDSAMDIFNATRAFAQQLAKQLSESTA